MTSWSKIIKSWLITKATVCSRPSELNKEVTDRGCLNIEGHHRGSLCVRSASAQTPAAADRDGSTRLWSLWKPSSPRSSGALRHLIGIQSRQPSVRALCEHQPPRRPAAAGPSVDTNLMQIHLSLLLPAYSSAVVVWCLRP